MTEAPSPPYARSSAIVSKRTMSSVASAHRQLLRMLTRVPTCVVASYTLGKGYNTSVRIRRCVDDVNVPFQKLSRGLAR